MLKMIKKYLSLLLALVLLLSSFTLPAFAEGETESELPEEEEIEYPDELIVGHPTITKGDFFTEMFGNDTADIDVRALLHGYNLVNWDQNQGVYLIDPSVVTAVEVFDDELGNRTYYMALADDLYYCDGTPITAWDYAFSLLLMMAPEIEEIGGKVYRCEHILGYREYMSGKEKTLMGVRVLSDHQLAITLDHNFLPYFFETGLLLCVPYPIQVIAPGCKVYANEYGEVYIGNEDLSIEEPIFTADLLRQTILDPDTGYNSHPTVTSGPYKLVSYDYKTAHFEINDYYKGAWIYNTLPDDFHFDVKDYAGVGSGTLIHNNHKGPNIYKVEKYDADGKDVSFYLVKPTIERIQFTVADNDTMAQDLVEGRLHLVNKVVYGPTIQECLGIGTVGSITPVPDHEAEEREAPAEETASGIEFQNYPRIGLAFVTFTYERPAVHEKEVRQAMAWCMDREAITREYTSGYGQVVNGYYGIEQWEYLICTGQLDYPVNFINDELHIDEETARRYRNMYASSAEEYENMIHAWEELNLDQLTVYTVDVDKANAILDNAGWTLNLDGGTYDPEVDEVRCKMIDGELVSLDLTMMYPRGNHIVDHLQEYWIDNLNACGIKLTLVPMDMEELLKSYYRESERTTDMIYLATNFHVIVDPSITYSTDTTAGHLIWNNTYSDDEDLYWRAVNMRMTDPKDIYEYVSKWIGFQERYNEVLPCIPIYSNIYFDFYTPQLQNYSITGHVTWSQAILEAYFGEGDGSAVTTVQSMDGDVIRFDD